MRHFNVFRPVFGFIACVLVCVATCLVSSCVDDTFDKYCQGTSGLLTFDVQVPGNWTDDSFSRAATNISINRMSQSGSGEPLYLVTEILEAAVDTAASDAVTRGTPVGKGNFYESFGLSAICYTGVWPEKEDENNWTTNFAHNLKVTNNGTSWYTEDKLDWVGSGKIRFFAYSPYPDTDELREIISHSGTSNKGTPTITYVVPEDVTKQPDLMTAVTDCNGGQGGTVSLNFTHALTAITVKTGNDMLAGTITGISISGVSGKGTYKIGSNKWELSDDKREFKIENMDLSLPVDKEENDKNIDTKPGIDIISGEHTFMMIPQTLEKDATLTVQFTDSLTQTERILTANLEGKTWPQGKKVIYSISSTGIKIEPVIDLEINHRDIWMNGKKPENPEAYLPVSGYLHDVQLAAYAMVAQADKETKIVPVSDVEIEYSINDGTWIPTKENKYGWFPNTENAISLLADNPTASVSGTILLPAQNAFEELREKAVKTGIFKTDEINGSKTGYYDLVNEHPFAKESANCYVINKPGYYKFPTWYGNTYKKDGSSNESAYTYFSSGAPNPLKNYILEKFVGHDDQPIDGTKSIPNVEDAVLVWQDSPDLVTDIKYVGNYVYFYMPKEAFNQGNAVIAVRNKKGTILWSWHIWATHCDVSQYQESKALNEYGRPFQFLCNNLGYCDLHSGDIERTIKICFYVSMPDGERKLVKNIKNGKGKDGIFTFTQPEIIESKAGDNTYFQWGRKDPMLPGVYNDDILNKAPITDGFISGYYPYVNNNDGKPWADYYEELDMENKVFYSTTDYKFHSEECGRSIGESIQMPHLFFIYPRPGIDLETDKLHDDKDRTKNYLRRHWHDGRNITIARLTRLTTSYDKRTIMNFWNSALDISGATGKTESPNNKYVVKTIYDPSPAGYKVPPPAAFSKFAKPKTGSTYPYGASMPDSLLVNFEDNKTGWKIGEVDGEVFFFPATGLRDMGIHHRTVAYGTFPAHARLTFIASSGFQDTNSASSSCLLFSIDNRLAATTNKQHVGIIYGTNNSYGFTLRPIRDGQKK